MQGSQIIGRNNVKNALLTNNDEIIVSKSPFSAFSTKEEDEIVFKGNKGFMNPELIALHVEEGILKIHDDDNIDLEILKSLIELQYANSRMITMYLNLLGINVNQTKVKKRLKYMNSSVKIISAKEFRSKNKEGKVISSPTSIYYLNKASIIILESQEIKISYDLQIALKSKNGIKEILARNQFMLEYALNVKNIKYTKFNPIHKLKNGEEYSPNLQIAIDYKEKTQHMMFEVVRGFDGWEKKLIDKLELCKHFIESFIPSKTMGESPLVIIAAEDDHHAFAIMKLLLANDLIVKSNPYLFTTDNRIITSKINNSIFRFAIENNKATAKILDIEMFKL